VWAAEEREHGGKAAISMNVGRGRIQDLERERAWDEERIYMEKKILET
jgi:hypothetical protein